MPSTTIELYAIAKDLAGTDAATIELPAGATANDAINTLITAHPRLAPITPACRLAINNQYAADDAPIPPGATLSLIPPVSGG